MRFLFLLRIFSDSEVQVDVFILFTHLIIPSLAVKCLSVKGICFVLWFVVCLFFN